MKTLSILTTMLSPLNNICSLIMTLSLLMMMLISLLWTLSRLRLLSLLVKTLKPSSCGTVASTSAQSASVPSTSTAFNSAASTSARGIGGTVSPCPAGPS